MGLFDRLGDRLRDIKDDYDTRKAEEAAILEEERKLIRDYNLQRTGQTGRYLVDSDHVIEVNLRSPENIQAARAALDEYQRNPKVRKVSKTKAKEFARGAGSKLQSDASKDVGQDFGAKLNDYLDKINEGMCDLTSVGDDLCDFDDYDFFTGETRKPQKKRKKSSKKK